jgi:hypothetical protein
VDGLDHPECVSWSPTEGLLYAGGEAGQVYRFPLHDGAAEPHAIVEGGFEIDCIAYVPRAGG